jgi:hypothetical protein
MLIRTCSNQAQGTVAIVYIGLRGVRCNRNLKPEPRTQNSELRTNFLRWIKIMSLPRSPRQSKHNYPNQPCPQGFYRWNNGFSSGCKPVPEDRRRLARQFHNVGGPLSLRQPPMSQANGWNNGYSNGLPDPWSREWINRTLELGSISPDTLLWRASQGGHRDLVQQALNEGATDFNQALVGAAGFGHLDIVKQLLDHGANNYDSAIFSAQINHHQDVVDYLKQQQQQQKQQQKQSLKIQRPTVQASKVQGPTVQASKIQGPTVQASKIQGPTVQASKIPWSVNPEDDDELPPTFDGIYYDGAQALSDNDIKARLLDILSQANQPVPTLELARQVFGRGASKKMVNPALYSLLRHGRVNKLADERDVNPRWELIW